LLRKNYFANIHVPFFIACDWNRDERKNGEIRRRHVYAPLRRRSDREDLGYFGHPRNPLVTWKVAAA